MVCKVSSCSNSSENVITNLGIVTGEEVTGSLGELQHLPLSKWTQKITHQSCHFLVALNFGRIEADTPLFSLSTSHSFIHSQIHALIQSPTTPFFHSCNYKSIKREKPLFSLTTLNLVYIFSIREILNKRKASTNPNTKSSRIYNLTN